METTVPLVIAGISLAFLALGAIADDRRARRARMEVGRIELPLLHSINDDRCIGCEACVDVCPTEVLELDAGHKARVVRFSDCVQCEQCANACPTTALVMYRQGEAPKTLTVPELDDHFMTGVPGQYLIGEVAGKPLVKNAANLGRAVIEHISRDLAAKPAAGQGVLDVVVVGSGPGGLSAGLTCVVKKLSVMVIEKEQVMASTVARYPKGKLFMAEPAESGNLSYLPVFDATKEQLVATWTQVAQGVKLPVKLGESVESVKRGDDGIFTVKTTVATYKSRTVVLATGLRGKPRLLTVPGANLEKVQSRLEDPDVYGGQHVLVVGGGDSAVEAAVSLADAGATVTLSYRGDGFKRCKQGNQKRLAEMTGQISVLLESNVKEFTPDAVSIALKDGTVTTIPNQQAFVLIGADTPVVWLEANNVRFIEREHLYALGSTMDSVKKIVPDAAECSKTAAEAIAVILGSAPARPSKLPKPAKPRARTEKSVIFRLKDEFKDMVHELTGVFKIDDIEQPRSRQKQKTQAVQTLRGDRRTGPAALIPGDRVARKPQPTKLFAHHDDSHPFTPVSTTVEVMSLPAMLKARQAAAEATQSGFDAEEATFARPRSEFAFGDTTAGGERTVVDGAPLLHKPLGKKDLAKTKPMGALVDNKTKPMGAIDNSRPKAPTRPPPPPTRGRT